MALDFRDAIDKGIKVSEERANDRQVGGEHYKTPGIPEHWDLVIMYNWDYFQGQITKYVMRWRKKGGIQDLKKALHVLEKYIESEEAKIASEALRQATIEKIRAESSTGEETPRSTELP